MAVGALKDDFVYTDASRVIGDSPIAEMVGLGGGCALARTPKAPSNVSGQLESAIGFSMKAERIAVSQHRQWQIPALNDMGTPLGLDVRKCLELSISLPFAVTIPNVKADNPSLGAGIARVNLELIKTAVEYLDEISLEEEIRK
jgi:hypothetical protein